MLELERDGAQLVPQALTSQEVDALLLALQGHDIGRPGSRIGDLTGLGPWLAANGLVGRMVAQWLGPCARPVRIILFDKNASANWALGWHQDRTIAVNKRAEVAGFNHWNRKDGTDHVEPPFDLIERMLTVRIHLDPVNRDNAPLLVAPGTHRLGKVGEGQLAEVIELHGSLECRAEAGDIWVYRTAIVHASKRSLSTSRRRVLQVDYSSDVLPEPLRWSFAA